MTAYKQAVHVVCAKGEEDLAEQLAGPLRDAGYAVTHHGTVAVGESTVGTDLHALTSGAPIVLCATTRAVGSAWSHQIVNAGHAGGHNRVFVVQMERHAYIEQLAVKTKVARFCDDPATAVRDLVAALAKHYPPVLTDAGAATPVAADEDGQYLDRPTDAATFDVDALQRFRAELRNEVADRYPPTLSPWEFLERANLWVAGRLTRTGALLFGKSPTAACSAAMVKCVRYHGVDRADRREIETFEGTVPDQIVAAREFVARHVQRGEQPSAGQAQSEFVYDYPMIAVREIIANALAHRDYTIADACVHVRIFTDRLEIGSPGSWLGHDLPEGAHRDLTALDGQSRKRNFRLAHVLSWVRLVEGEGSGIPSALRDCRNAGAPIPTVLRDQGFITVTLRPRRPDEPTDGHATGIGHRVVPAQLPHDIAGFVGRHHELEALERALGTGQPGESPAVSVITGMAGVGKTALAVHFAHRVRHRFPDGLLYAHMWADGSGAATPLGETLAHFLNALGVAPRSMPTELEDRSALYRSLLADRRVLVVLDDVASAEEVLGLLPGSSGSHVLVTSRNRLSSLTVRTGGRRTSLDVLTLDEATAFLAQRLGSDRVAAEPHAAAELIDLCGRLPLALAIVAERVAGYPSRSLADLATELQDVNRRRDILDSDEGLSIVAAFSWSYRSLSPKSARVFRLLAQHSGPDIGLPAAAALVDLPPNTIHRLLDELCAAHLLEEHRPGRYRFHNLIQMYAAAQSSSEDTATQRSTALRRVLQHYAEHAARYQRHLDHVRIGTEVDSYAEALHWFSEEQVVLLPAVTQAVQLGFDELAVNLASAVAPFLKLRGYWHDLVDVHSIALRAAERLDDAMAQAHSHQGLGTAYAQFGRLADAVEHYQHSLELCRRLGDRNDEGRTLLALGGLHQRRNEHNTAVEHARLALELFRVTTDRRGEAAALVTLAGCQTSLGHYDGALRELAEARRISRELADTTAESAILEKLGFVHHRRGRYRAALEHYEEALRLARTLGDRYAEAVTANRMGDTYEALDDPGQARASWQHALALLNEFADPDADTVRAKLVMPAEAEPTAITAPHQTILVIDIAQFGHLERAMAARKGLFDALHAAFRRSGIDWESCRVEDRGDGVLILAPAGIPKTLFVTALPRELAATLREHNDSNPATQIRVRVALHAGEVQIDPHGVAGASVNFAFRLVDAVQLREALDRSDGTLALIMSDWFYEEVVRHQPGEDIDAYNEIEVSVKETRATAWTRLPSASAETSG